MRTRILGFVGALTLLLAGFVFLARPWYRTWGATADELRRPLPGDQIVPGDVTQETRAISIAAPVDAVWPWVAQLGQYRGGFYSFDQLENAVGCEMPTTDVLNPAHQRWVVGDTLWMYGRDKAGGVGFAILREFIPGRALAFSTTAIGSPQGQIDGSWAFVVEPIDAATTRLIIRGRLTTHRSALAKAVDVFVFEPMHFVMERRTMLGLAEVAVHGARDRAENTLHIALWIITCMVFVAAGIAVFRRAQPEPALATLLTAGVVFMVLTLGQPSPLVGGPLVAALIGAHWGLPPLAPRRARATTAPSQVPLPHHP